MYGQINVVETDLWSLLKPMYVLCYNFHCLSFDEVLTILAYFLHPKGSRHFLLEYLTWNHKGVEALREYDTENHTEKTVALKLRDQRIWVMLKSSVVL